MRKLPPVEEAKALMTEAREWSVWRWLTEKRRVRAAADRAVDALGEEERKVKAGWSEELQKAYSNGRGRKIDVEIKAAVQGVKEADEIAEAARLDAEKTFDEAERFMSPGMARQGAQKAIESWELREKAIRKAEAAGRKK
jgi:hypothetical protein